MSRLIVPTTLALLCALPTACSGAAPVDLFGSGSGDAGLDSASGSSGGSSSGSSGSGSSSGGSGAGLDSGRIVDSSGGSSPDSGGDDANSPDARALDSGSGSQHSVPCPSGGRGCQNGDVCCVTTAPLGGTQTDSCQSPATTCSGTPITCASTADCKQGEICCGTETMTLLGTTYHDVSCQSSCSGTNRIPFCDAKVADCPSGTTCQASTLLQGYTVCR